MEKIKNFKERFIEWIETGKVTEQDSIEWLKNTYLEEEVGYTAAGDKEKAKLFDGGFLLVNASKEGYYETNDLYMWISKEGKLYASTCGTCSCFGCNGQYDPEEINIEYFKNEYELFKENRADEYIEDYNNLNERFSTVIEVFNSGIIETLKNEDDEYDE